VGWQSLRLEAGLLHHTHTEQAPPLQVSWAVPPFAFPMSVAFRLVIVLLLMASFCFRFLGFIFFSFFYLIFFTSFATLRSTNLSIAGSTGFGFRAIEIGIAYIAVIDCDARIVGVAPYTGNTGSALYSSHGDHVEISHGVPV
jgi:hypothetical protein